MKYEGNGSTNHGWCTWNDHQIIGKGTGKFRNQTSRNHPDHSMIKIGQTTAKSPGDLRRLSVT